jgi:hypothetical protein
MDASSDGNAMAGCRAKGVDARRDMRAALYKGGGGRGYGV